MPPFSPLVQAFSALVDDQIFAIILYIKDKFHVHNHSWCSNVYIYINLASCMIMLHSHLSYNKLLAVICKTKLDPSWTATLKGTAVI